MVHLVGGHWPFVEGLALGEGVLLTPLWERKKELRELLLALPRLWALLEDRDKERFRGFEERFEEGCSPLRRHEERLDE